jgi:hypothetical protein
LLIQNRSVKQGLLCCTLLPLSRTVYFRINTPCRKAAQMMDVPLQNWELCAILEERPRDGLLVSSAFR